MKSWLILLFLGGCCGVLSGCIFSPTNLHLAFQPPKTTQNQLAELANLNDHQLTALQIHNKQITVEVVKTPDSLTQGLSDRNSIGSDGMFFLLPTKDVPRFWMKEMNFGLDFIWLDDLRVIDLTENVPPPTLVQRQDSSQLPIYSPRSPANMVLEVPVGTILSWQLKIGDKFTLVQK